MPLHISTKMELVANSTQGVSTEHIQDWWQHPKYFMIDEQFYNTWTSIFGKITQTSKLICSWHVDWAWRGALNRIEDKPTQQTVHHNLHVLLDETDISRFEKLL